MSDTASVAVNQHEKQQEAILNGNMWRVMFELSWPAVIAMVLYGFNAVLDGIFIGKYVGQTAMAGVSIAYPLSQISGAFGAMIGSGAGALLSISIGAKDTKTQEGLMGNVNILCLLSALVFMVLGLTFSTELMKMMGGTGEALLLGDRYFRITIVGSFFYIYGLAANMIVRAEGRMKKAAVMMGAGLVVNAVVNYILMAVFDFGVAGAAWGTNIGMLVYCIVGWIYFGKGYASFKTKVASLRWNSKIGMSIIQLGFSSFIMQVMNLIQAVFIFNSLSKYGTTTDIAFFGVLNRILTFLMTPIFGLMRALQPTIGINFGAGQYERLIKFYKIFAVAAMVLTLPFWAISMISPSTVVGLMLKGYTMTSIQYSCFRINLSILPMMPFIFMSMTLYPSIGKGKPAAIIGIARQLIFYIPAMIILPSIFGVAGIYYGSFAIDFTILIIILILIKREFRLLRKKESSVRTGTLSYS